LIMDNVEFGITVTVTELDDGVYDFGVTYMYLLQEEVGCCW
jgi:hypothetical protein